MKLLMLWLILQAGGAAPESAVSLDADKLNRLEIREGFPHIAHFLFALQKQEDPKLTDEQADILIHYLERVARDYTKEDEDCPPTSKHERGTALMGLIQQMLDAQDERLDAAVIDLLDKLTYVDPKQFDGWWRYVIDGGSGGGAMSRLATRKSDRSFKAFMSKLPDLPEVAFVQYSRAIFLNPPIPEERLSVHVAALVEGLTRYTTKEQQKDLRSLMKSKFVVRLRAVKPAGWEKLLKLLEGKEEIVDP